MKKTILISALIGFIATANAENNEGLVACDAEKIAQAIEVFAPLAEQGDAAAQTILGIAYENGFGVEKDYAQALSWFRKASEQDYAEAEFKLGVMLSKGLGIQQDELQAVVWYRKSAEQNFAAAQFNLGVMYEKGRGESLWKEKVDNLN